MSRSENSRVSTGGKDSRSHGLKNLLSDSTPPTPNIHRKPATPGLSSSHGNRTPIKAEHIDWVEKNCLSLSPSTVWAAGPGIEIFGLKIVQTRNSFASATKCAAFINQKVSSCEQLDVEFEVQTLCGGLLVGMYLADISASSFKC